MSDITTVIGAISSGVMALIWWDIRTIRKEVQAVRREVQDVKELHHMCQLELPTKYAGKEDTRGSFKKLFDIMDEHSKIFSYWEGLRNGTPKKP